MSSHRGRVTVAYLADLVGYVAEVELGLLDVGLFEGYVQSAVAV